MKTTFKPGIIAAAFIVFIGVFNFAFFSQAGLIADNDSQSGGFELDLVSDEKDFKISQAPDFYFKFTKKRNFIAGFGAMVKSLFVDEYKNLKIESVVFDANTDKALGGLKFKVDYAKNGKFSLSLSEQPRAFKPGKYKVAINVTDSQVTGGETISFSQDFTWGVLALNTSKSIYLPTETAYLQMAVLDDKGNTICDSKLYLEVTAPDGGVAYLNTDNGLIARNAGCGANNVIDTPDYQAFYGLAGSGSYHIRLISETANGLREIIDSFEVRDSVPFDIGRSGPTRVYPLADYEMKISINANEDYSGDIIDIVPAGFKTVDAVCSIQYAGDDSGSLHTTYRILNTDNGEQQIIFSDIDLKPGDVAELKYTIDFPDVSPEFYLVGPLTIGEFSEIREWQIASDAVNTFDYTAGSIVGNWNGATTQPWDSANDTYASHSITKKVNPDSAAYLQGNANAASELGGVITAVEIGIEGYVQNTAVSAYIVPYFNGSSAGSQYSITGATLGTTDSNNTFYVDVTNSANAPSTWTWADVQNMDARVFGGNSSPSTNYLFYVDQIRVRVTYNLPPTATIDSAVQKTDGSGTIDIAFTADDAEADDLMVKMEYVSGAGCDFSSPLDPDIDTNNITASSGAPVVDNASAYQIGTTTGWVITSGGANTVNFDWLSGALSSGTYCIRLTANDQMQDQATPATTTVVIDNTPPVISNVTFLPSSGVLSIGNTATATIVSDGTGYTAGIITVNDVNVAGTLQSAGGNNYTVTYTVQPGDNNIADSENLPVSIALKDGFGTSSLAYTATDVSGRPGVDATAPEILTATIPDLLYGIGSTITATITVTSDTDTYTLATSSINSATSTTGNLRKINDTTYLLDYTVSSGDTDRASGTIPYVLVLRDSIGTLSNTFSGNFSGGRIDTIRPVINSVTITNGAHKIGSAIDVFINADAAGYSLSTTTVNGKSVSGFTDQGGGNYKVTYTVAEGDADRLSGDIPVSVLLIDPAGNPNNPVFTTPSGNSASVDANKPSIVSVTMPNLSYKVGDVIRATTTVVNDAVLNDTYTLGVTTINGVSVTNLQKVNGTTYTFDYTVVNGNADQLGGSIPYSVILVDSAGQYNDPAFSGSASGYIDAHRPVISNVTFLPSSGIMNIGDTATATIISDGTLYTAGAMTVNGQNVSGTLQSAGGNNYTVTYTVQEGDPFRQETDDLPVSLVLADSYGNNSSAYITADSGNRPGVDANRPIISNVTFNPSSGLLKIGDTATATIISDGINYTAGTITVNGVNVAGTLASAGGNNYTVTYTVQAGHTDIPDGNDLPISVTLADPAGNNSTAYETSDAGNRPGVDGHAPTITNVTFLPSSGVLKIGDTATATIISDGISYTAGTITVNGVNVAGTLQSAGGNNYTVSYTVQAGDTDILDADNLPISITLVDPAGNNSSAYTTADAGNRPGVDGHAPTITNVTFSPTFGILKIGDTATATIISDGINYTAGTITVNGVNVAGTLQSAGGNNYTVAYTVAEGHTDIPDGNDLPISVTLVDPAGNNSFAYTTPDAGNRPGVDGHAPAITSYQIPNFNFKIGDTITATITVSADPAVYTISSSTLSGIPTTNLVRVSDTTYTVDHLITAGEIDRSNGNIPYYLIFADPAGNTNVPSSGTSGGSIDANAPVISNVTFNPSSGLLKIGDTATATIISDGINYTAGTITVNGVNVAGTLASAGGNDYTVTYIVAEGHTDIPDGNDLPISVTLADPAGNNSSAYTTADSGNRPGVDGHAPTAPGPLSFTSHTNESITLNLGATTTEANFLEYRIYHKVGSSGVTENDMLWGVTDDPNLGNINFNGASTTTVTGLEIGTEHVFKIWAYDTAGNKASSSEFTASTNAQPYNLGSLGQYKNDGSTAITNGAWTTENTVKLRASANDPDADEIITLYFELLPAAGTFTTATSQPAGACVYGTAYADCGSKIWFVASSSPADYSVTPFTDTASITAVPDSVSGYKWQVVACDTGAGCSAWQKFNLTAPNFKVDNTLPTVPGNLGIDSKTSTSITLSFGATSSETNFLEYRIYHTLGTPGVTENDLLHSSSTDPNLGFVDFNGAATTTIGGMTAGTLHYFNIWVYDQAGNKANAALEISTTTVSSSNPPTGSFNSAALKTDGSGRVDISILADDQDNDDVRARIDYEAGTSCAFSSPLDPSLDENPVNASSSYGTISLDNASLYQVGTSTGWIKTNQGENTVNFDWLSKTDLPGSEGYYCLRLTLNDGALDQSVPATTTVYIDNIDPDAPGSLYLGNKQTESLVLNFGASSSDTNFDRYKIFYKQGASGVTEGDTEKIDVNLDDMNYNGATTTSITGLSAGTQYVMNIWAYDAYGNKASALEYSDSTNHIPADPSSLGQFKNDGVTAIPGGGWTTENNVKLSASVNDADNPEALSLYFQFITDGGSFLTATTVPAGVCAPDEAFGSCGSKVWATTSPSGNYSSTPFTGTVNPTAVPDSAAGYKWQVMSCDAKGACSSWSGFGAVPALKIDTISPTAPGNMTLAGRTSDSVTLNFGASSTEINFFEYRIYYKQAASGVSETDSLFSSSSDANLGYVNYNGAATTIISGLSAGLDYVFNIWVYDRAGNKANAAELAVTTNMPPTGTFVSAGQKTDGSGAIDISIEVYDDNADYARARLDYVAGADCNFASPLDPTLDTADANATSTFDDAKIDNGSAYQIGSSSGWILTAFGPNTVSFDWLSKTDIPAADGVYCLRLAANDQIEDQTVLATTTLTIDNANPTIPGQLSFSAKTGSSLTLAFGATTTETNFKEYKIFYREGVGVVTEADTSHIDADLGDQGFNGTATTEVSGLLADTQYSFKIFAYDDYGNKASAEQITFKTNAPPTGAFNSAAGKIDGSGAADISIQVYDVDGDDVRAKLEYVSGIDCNFASPLDPTLDENPASISAATGTVIIDNASASQIGTSTGWIITSAGANTVNFDWLSETDLPGASGSYCLRLTANDGTSDQAVLATTTVYIDNQDPAVPGNLSAGGESGLDITLLFGATSTDVNFEEYKIFYKQGGSGVTEADSEFNKFSDPNLGSADFGGATTTTVSGLASSMQYVFNIWAYDEYGNKAAAAQEFSTSTTELGPATWRENEDVVLPTLSQYLGKEEPVRLRIAVADTGDWQAENYNYRIQYGAKTDTCEAIGSWSNVPVFASSEHFEMIDSVYFTDGASTTARLANSEGYAFTAGYMVDRPSNQTGAQSLNGGSYTEIEYAFQPSTNATASGTYCFRLANSDTVIDSYDAYPEVTIAPPPSGSFISAAQKTDGSGKVDISISVSDLNGDKAKAKLEYVAGAECDFATPLDPTLDENQANIDATFGQVAIDNASEYQIGTSTQKITTAFGANTVDFDWDTQADIPAADGTYCLRLTVNDGYDDQSVSATTTVIVDRINPTIPGDLSVYDITSNSVTLTLGTSTTESHFSEYKIFYKEGSSGVTESDLAHSSSTDPNLGYANFNGATSTPISGLSINRQYVFKIWAYDLLGNKSSSVGEVTATIRYQAKSQNWQFFYDRQNETPTSSAAAENTAPSTILAGSILKLRLTLKEADGITGDNVKMRLQYSTYSDFSSNVSFIDEMSSSTAIWTYGDGVDADNAAITALKLSDSDAPATHNESGISSSTYSFPANSAAEFEFTIRNNGAPISTTYYFRAYDNVNDEPVVKNTDESYPSLITEGAVMSYATQGLSAGTSTEGVVTNVDASGSMIAFGTLDFDAPMIAAQRFTIDTNSGEGYQLFVYQKQDFLSDFGAIIEPVPGTNEAPQAWPAVLDPSGFGYHSGDDVLSGASPSRFASDNSYARFESTMKEISYSPVQVSNKQVDFVVRLEVTNQQSAGEYLTDMVYIIVPTY